MHRALDAYYAGGWDRIPLPESLGGFGAPPSLRWAVQEFFSGRQRQRLPLRVRPAHGLRDRPPGHPRAAGHLAQVAHGPALGGHHGADRGRRRVRRGGGHHQGHPGRGQRLSHRRRQALHHQRRRRLLRERPAPDPGQGPRRRPRHQGPVVLHRPQVPGGRRRRPGRVERGLGHQDRGQDGHQGVGDLRAHLRPRQALHRLPAGRRARGHPPDVPRPRGRPHEHRRQVGGHHVHRVPQRPGVRQGAHPERRHHPDPRPQRPPGGHHPPPRRAPHADPAEGLRRRDAGPDPVLRLGARPDHAPSRGALLGQALRPAAPPGQGLLLREGLRPHGAVPAGAGRLRVHQGLPAGAVRPGPQDRQPVRGHHRHPGPGPVLPQDLPRPGRDPDAPGRRDHRDGQGRGRRRRLRPGAGTARQGHGGHPGPVGGHGRLRHDVHAGPDAAVQGRPAHQRPAREPGRGGHGLAAACATPRSPTRPCPGPRPRTRPSTRARSPRLAGSPPTSCPGRRCAAPWPRRSRAS